MLKQEMMFFNYMFFGPWREKMRENMGKALGDSSRQQMVDSLSHLYHKISAKGKVL